MLLYTVSAVCIQGNAGHPGDIGMKGETGMKGDTGPKGHPGNQGPLGEIVSAESVCLRLYSHFDNLYVRIIIHL